MTLADQLADQRRKVDFDTYDISVQQLLSMLEQKAIDVAPAYQRHYRWDRRRQCQLIESIFLGIPIPSLFMATNSNGTWEVVDGVQRISTLVDFAGSDALRQAFRLQQPLNISGLEKLSALKGTFLDLPPSLQLHFMLRPIKVVTLSDKSDLVVRFDLFERLNTGGIELTDQEIRSCVFRGPFDDFLTKMSASDNFRATVLLPPGREKDGTRDEFVLRFFAFLHNYEGFEHSVREFLNAYMKSATQVFDYRTNEEIFRQTFTKLKQWLPTGIRKTQAKTPVNLFEGIAVGSALAIGSEREVHWERLEEWLNSEELKGYITSATNDKRRVRDRIEKTRNRLLE